MLDVRRLRVLQEVVTRGSFSAAAESLHLSQSAVSQQIAVLEKEVGIPLLQRTSEGPKLTSAGDALMSHGDAVLCRLEDAERELAQIAGLEGGRLRLASFPTASATLMTKALSVFRERFPKIELQFSEDEPEDSFPGLKRGDFDLAVVFDYPDFPLDFSRDVEAELIYELIGRMVVGFIRWRYGRELRIAAGAGVALTVLGVGAYLASRGEDSETD